FVLIVMAFLAALALLFSRGADRLSDRWTAQLSQSSTVQIMISEESNRDAEMQTAREILRETLPRARIDSLSRPEAAALIQPWMGDGQLPDDLPIPGVIRIETAARLPFDSLVRQFEAAGLTAAIDDHSRFSGQLHRTVGRLVILGAALLLLIGFAAMAVNVFATRSSLAAQRDIIHVLVQAGASDSFVARLFVGQAGRRGLVGAGIGMVLAFLLWIVVSIGPGQGSVGWHGVKDGVYDGVMLATLAFLFGSICAAAAGWAALRQLAYERRRA
ncbi:MAG: FtsX-like permease family protein, partial [Pseudomonadota bacterium]